MALRRGEVISIGSESQARFEIEMRISDQLVLLRWGVGPVLIEHKINFLIEPHSLPVERRIVCTLDHRQGWVDCATRKRIHTKCG